MTSRRDRVALGAVTIGLLALAGCSNTAAGTDAQREPSIGDVPTVAAGMELRLPVEAYLPTREQTDRLATARLALIRRCMARFGVEYDVEPAPASSVGPLGLTDRRYGITDAGLARADGYGLGARDPSRLPKPARPDIGPRGETALTGQGPSVVNGEPVPSGGCLAEADRFLDREVPRDADPGLGQQTQFRSFELTKQDSRVRAAFRAWSDCMLRSGHRYTDPLAAAADPAFAVAGVTADEIAVATADIDCKARTNLVGVWFTVESAYQRRDIDADRSAFTAALAAISARDRAAAAVH